MAERAREVEEQQPDGEATPRKGGKPRFCPVCGVKISSYNPGPNCWQHTIGHPWRGPTAKPKF